MSFELDGRHVVERLVDSAVVEPADVVERRPFDVLDVAPGPLAVDQLSLIETVERFGERVIVAVTPGADRGHDLGLAETFGVANAEGLNAAVRMKNQTAEVVLVARVDRHLQGVDR